MATSWYYKIKRFVKSLVKFNEPNIKFNQSGVQFGGQMPSTTWTYKNKN